jgi:hypothetical protein
MMKYLGLNEYATAKPESKDESVVAAAMSEEETRNP